MHSHIRLALCLFLFVSLWHETLLSAEEPVGTKQISYEDLAALGDEIDARETFKDNEFLYRDQTEQIRQYAQTLPGGDLSFAVEVRRVTGQEVFLFVPDAGDTRVALQHPEPPAYGNLHTVIYFGPPSVKYAQILSKPITLRIGSEIKPEIAKGLRRGDVLVLNGRLQTIHLLLDVFVPQAIAVISDVEVAQVNPKDAETKYFYE